MREFATPGLPELGVLYVAPPLAHIRGTLMRLLFGSGLPLDDPVEEVPAIEVTPEGLSHLRKLLLGGLSEAELRERRAVLVEKCSGFGLVSPGRMFEVVCRAGYSSTSTETREKKAMSEASALRRNPTFLSTSIPPRSTTPRTA